MRVKINDKIYRLKEIESGVDSLMELVEEPKYKKGDFLVKEYKDVKQYIFILDYISDDGTIYFHCYHVEGYNKTRDVDDFGIGRVRDAYHKCIRYATDSEKELLIAELSKVGKRWNDEKKCIEDIPQRKFKAGDKVRIKDGISSKTHSDIAPLFLDCMDDLIGTTMTVNSYTDSAGYVACEEYGFFHEDWLEPYTDEPKEGDLAIFWDDNKKSAIIRFYDRYSEEYFQHTDRNKTVWENAIKFESKEQYERFIKGEI